MPRFLIDENVRSEVDSLLRNQKCDFIRVPKGSSDKIVAAISHRENRVIVTNDIDFTLYSNSEVFGVILLRIPQRDVQRLLQSFETLLAECKEWKGKFITLQPEQWESTQLAS